MRIHRISFLSLLIILISCSKEEQLHDRTGDGGLLVSIFEDIQESGERKTILSLVTDEIFPCANYGLDMTSSFADGRWTADIKDVINPDVCLTALGPAVAQVDWRYLDNGSYPIYMRAFGRTSTGTLLIDDVSYQLDFPIKDNIKIEQEKLFKIPDHTIWGLIGYAEPSAELAVDAFFEELKNIGGTALKLPQGHYGYFDVDTDGIMVVPKNHGYWYAKSILYEFDGDPSELGELVRKYGNEFAGINNVRIRSSWGENFYSWIN